jgi:hypothetical protein
MIPFRGAILQYLSRDALDTPDLLSPELRILQILS